MNPNTYKQIRAKLFEALPKNTVTFLFAGDGNRKSADADYPYYANRNFVYGTGIEEQEAVVAYDTSTQETTLFLRDINPDREKWVGYFMTNIEAIAISGIENVLYFEEFEAYVASVLERDVNIGIDFDDRRISDVAHGSGASFMLEMPQDRVVDVFEDIVACRQVKLPEEVEAIRHSCEVTNQAIFKSLEHMVPGHNENEVASRFLYEANKEFGTLTFDTICASGKNATVLHYIENNNTMEDGDLLLMDLGIKIGHYGADISRTFPVNGKFTQRQKDVYQVVLDTFYTINEAIRPGISIATLQEIAKESLGEGCVSLGLIDDPADVTQYYYHGIGHSLGLDTHDVWLDREAELVEGNVITNEPGLYIAEEGIGVRIETDVLVTANSYEDLAPQIIKEISDIEAYFMK